MVREGRNCLSEFRKVCSDVFYVVPINLIESQCNTDALFLVLRIPVWFQPKSAEVALVRGNQHLLCIICGNCASTLKKLSIEAELAIEHAAE
ncbi:hypothetical protein AJ88_39450 [Mesorhizobium amorphae CCBAU 01583]|nr:hypothetical protein AJ88_39450 [Mesorhizobium amorphae CCBAU 01583]